MPDTPTGFVEPSAANLENCCSFLEISSQLKVIDSSSDRCLARGSLAKKFLAHPKCLFLSESYAFFCLLKRLRALNLFEALEVCWKKRGVNCCGVTSWVEESALSREVEMGAFMQSNFCVCSLGYSI